MLTKDEKTARDLACAKQERSHAQMGDMLETFDRYDAEARRRPRALPGAPLPPDPRLAQQPQPPPALQAPSRHEEPPMWQLHHHQSQQQQPPSRMPVHRERVHEQPHHRQYDATTMPRLSQPLEMPPERRADSFAPSPDPVQRPPMQRQGMQRSEMQRAPAPVHAPAMMRPDQAADAQALETRRRAQGARPW